MNKCPKLPLSHRLKMSKLPKLPLSHRLKMSKHPKLALSYRPKMSKRLKLALSYSPKMSKCLKLALSYSPKMSKHPKLALSYRPKMSKRPKLALSYRPKMSKCPKLALSYRPKMSKCPKLALSYWPKMSKHPKLALHFLTDPRWVNYQSWQYLTDLTVHKNHARPSHEKVYMMIQQNFIMDAVQTHIPPFAEGNGKVSLKKNQIYIVKFTTTITLKKNVYPSSTEKACMTRQDFITTRVCNSHMVSTPPIWIGWPISSEYAYQVLNMKPF